MAETAPTTTPYSRRISFNEKLYLATHQRAPGFCIQIVMTSSSSSSSLTLSTLTAAVSAAAAANPGARLIARGVLGWARWVAAGPVPPVRVLHDWVDEETPAALSSWLSPHEGPTCEVVWAPGPPTRLVFRCFHGVMDARGLLHFAQDVFRALRGEPLVGSDGALNDTEFVRSLSGPSTPKRPMLKGERRAVTTTKARTTSASSIIHRRFSVPLRGRATVARIAVGLTQHATKTHVTPTRVMVPVDLRFYQRELRATGNLTCPLFIDVDIIADWRAVQRDIVKRLIAKEAVRLDPTEVLAAWLPIAAVRVLFAMWNGRHARSRRFPASALISHMSLPEAAALSCEGFAFESAYFVPNQDNFLPLAVAVISDAEHAHIVVSAPSGIVDDDALDAVCEAIRAATQMS